MWKKQFNECHLKEAILRKNIMKIRYQRKRPLSFSNKSTNK